MNCSVEDCDRKRKFKNGYCNMHNHRFVRHGDVTIVKKIVGVKHCAVDGCPYPYQSKGYCDRHYAKLRKYGDPLVSKITGRYLNKKGYAFVPDPTKRLHTIAEHRLVMQQYLGRDLTRNENVHHINGDRQDNRIENLELWNTSQPSGQRVEDKVKFAIEILKQYAPQELTDWEAINYDN